MFAAEDARFQAVRSEFQKPEILESRLRLVYLEEFEKSAVAGLDFDDETKLPPS